MYNEATAVGAVVAELRHSFDHVVCVDDGSTDDSARVATAAGATVLRHPINLGMGAALQTGFSYALRNGAPDWIVTFDADGQHRVTDAVHMVERARREAVDLVLGSRFLGGPSTTMPATRRAVLRGAVHFTRVTSGLRVSDAHNGLRVLSRRAVGELRITMSGMAHASEILDQVAARGLSWVEHPVTVDYTDYSRGKGQSNLNAINISLDLIGKRLRTGGVRRAGRSIAH
uniref:glycosyltransferase family 2 protein n=1 Tax=Nocardioides terrisoli TaxID=3388267 RepID=UPI0037C6C70A